MDPERHQQIKSIFLQACDLSGSQRAEFLDQACGEDAILRREVESLLKYHEPTTIFRDDAASDAQGKLDRPVTPLSRTEVPKPSGHVATHSHFTSGTIIAGRYRIVGSLGRGGMGEVYRAEDLKLSQTVALKFLAKSHADNQAWLDRFHGEVRLARKVTHPNVTRVYDIDEADGDVFISMEYVDGEDLASLLRRIGRLPTDKAIEIARQLCLGLAAAHGQGVLHRDLKPANIMIDGRGQVRITDFGIAVLAEDTEQIQRVAGTPTYMAPELFQGREASVRSDIYSLGLVLYELITGLEPFGGVPAVRHPNHERPKRPSSVVPEIPSRVEQVIERCMEIDPERRPESALQIAAELPGDPLSAALAAGETPSPDLVAAAGDVVLIPKRRGVAMLAVSLLGLAAVVLLADRTFFMQQAGLAKPPAVLVDRAEQVIEQLGHQSNPRGAAFGFLIDEGFLHYMSRHEDRHHVWQCLSRGQPPAAFFWYREGDFRVVPKNPMGDPTSQQQLPLQPGMKSVRLDGQGRLTELIVMPKRQVPQPAAAADVDWSIPFTMAGLEIKNFAPVEPVSKPPMFAETIVSWQGVYPDNPDVPLRVDGALRDGRIVYFDVAEPWSDDPSWQHGVIATTESHSPGRAMRFVIFLITGLAGVVMATFNLRRGRGDRRGATRLAIFVLLLGLANWGVGQRHVPVFAEEFGSLYLGLALATFEALVLWVFYIALEPFVRRYWPHVMISWSRLLTGHFRDPLVGHDVLVGGLAGIAMVLLMQLDALLPSWLGVAEPFPKLPADGCNLGELLGIRFRLGTTISMTLQSITFGLVALMLMLLLRIVLRKPWLAIAVFCVLLTTVFSVGSAADTYLPWLANAALALIVATVMMRVGLLAGIVAMFFAWMLMAIPITSDLTAWYVGVSAYAVMVFVTLLLFGFFTSMTGQKLLDASMWKE